MAQNITLMGASYSDVPAVTLPKTGGGTAEFFDARSVTYFLSGGATVSANPSNAIAGQGFSVKVKAPAGYTLSNVSVTMGGVDITNTAFTPDASGGGGGGGSKLEKTGTVTGGGGTTLAIPCDFEPDEVYVYGDLSGDPTLRGVISVTILKNNSMYVSSDTSTSSTTESITFFKHNIIDYNADDTSSPHATYANNTLTIDMVSNTSSYRFASGISYSYDLVGYGEGGGGGGSATLISKSITANGTYDAGDDNADGYSFVTVTVPNTYASGDEGKVVSNGALVAQGSDTVTQNGTVDTTLISSLLVSVAGSGSGVKTGTVTPESASTTISFDTGLSSVTGILIMPVNTPLTGSRTQAAMICLTSGSFYKAISIHTNSGGTGWVSPSVYTSNRFTQSGTTVTVTGAYNFRPAVGYVWYAW